MKIEKLNENQIRCTLTHADLAARHLKLSELAYGTEKAKSLFRDMMQQASFDLGFEAENIPLMIEAIPSSADSIVLIITKVEDPEELDTRFSKFTPSGETEPLNMETLEKLEGADEFLNLLNKVKEAAASTRTAESGEDSAPPAFSVRIFAFEDLDGVIRASRLIATVYRGANTLYKDKNNGMFLLALAPSEHSTNEFNKICNMLSEYGSPEKADSSVLAYLEEHCDTVIPADAVQKLSLL
ncbi:MAG TPA: adaptor protein MecA [Candidatus Mediterraneibacter pullistercoris]|nr:adaptor protein MecA [Candidatus Mediterraneibacter pullistercoris]